MNSGRPNTDKIKRAIARKVCKILKMNREETETKKGQETNDSENKYM
jgi:hypothetical protein